MNVKHYADVAPIKVEDPAAHNVTMRVVIGPDQGAPNFVMRVFEVAPGGYSPRHQHDFEHEIFFFSGSGEVFDEGETFAVGPGHTAYVAPGALHQIRNVGDEKLVFVCLVPKPAG